MVTSPELSDALVSRPGSGIVSRDTVEVALLDARILGVLVTLGLAVNLGRDSVVANDSPRLVASAAVVGLAVAVVSCDGMFVVCSEVADVVVVPATTGNLYDEILCRKCESRFVGNFYRTHFSTEVTTKVKQTSFENQKTGP